MTYAALQASDGAGESIRATVQSPGRSIGSSVIPVNAITNYPTGTFIGITGKLTASNTLTNAQVFYGTASGTNITITSFAPGYSDLGNSAGDVVVIKPTTEWANLVAKFIMNATGLGTPEPHTVSTLNASGLATLAGGATIGGVTEITGTSYNAVQSVASGATITPASQVYRVTAQAVAATINTPSYTPQDGMTGELRIFDNGTAQNLTWAAGWKAIGVTLPTATVVGQFLYISYEYSAVDSKWHVLGIARG